MLGSPTDEAIEHYVSHRRFASRSLRSSAWSHKAEIDSYIGHFAVTQKR
jgi:hypothetical protein